MIRQAVLVPIAGVVFLVFLYAGTMTVGPAAYALAAMTWKGIFG